MKKKQTKWTEQEIRETKEFMKTPRSAHEKADYSKKLNRTWGAIYNKIWTLERPVRVKSKAPVKKENNEIVVTHLNKTRIDLPTTIKIGECVIETYSSKLKINDVLIEV